MSKKKAGPPAKHYLHEVIRELPGGGKCEHKDKGQWIVLWEDKLFTFDPPTQFQKDVWLGQAKQEVGEEAALSLLRWFCWICGTVQKP